MPSRTTAALKAHHKQLTSEGWWEACAELRKRHDVEALAVLSRAVLGSGLDEATMTAVVHHADRDLSQSTNREIGKRYGLTFAMHLPNMGWTRDDRLHVVSEALRDVFEGGASLEHVLAQQGDLSCFVFVTLVGSLAWPDRYLPWIAAVHEAVHAQTGGLPRRAPSVERYRTFVERTQDLMADLDCPPCMVDRVLYSIEPNPARSGFGRAPADPIEKPEPRLKTATAADLARTLDGYRALDERAAGRYVAYLSEASRCRTCSLDPNIPQQKQPISVLAGVPDLQRPSEQVGGDLVAAGKALERHRRPDGSLIFEPSDSQSVPELEDYLDEQGLAGLFIGQCGWTDLSAFVRGPEMGHGTQLMILGNDWYPLTRCANFFPERHELETNGTLTRFLRELSKAERPGEPPSKPTAAGLERFLRERRVYLANTLSCFRTGWDTTGPANLSTRSFEHCALHVRRHILAVQPSVVVTFGANSCSTVASLVEASEPSAQETVAALRKANRTGSLGAIMEACYQDVDEPAGLLVRLGELELRHVPLYHPSFAHLNRYERDYSALARAMGSLA